MKWHTKIAATFMILHSIILFSNPPESSPLMQEVLHILNDELKPADHFKNLNSVVTKIGTLHKQIDPERPCHQNLFNERDMGAAEQSVRHTHERIEMAIHHGFKGRAKRSAHHLRFYYDRAALLVEQQKRTEKSRSFLIRFIKSNL